jgi:tol-pal system protein YbgF
VNGNNRLAGAAVVAVAALLTASTAVEAAWWTLGKPAVESPVIPAQADGERFNRIENQMRSLTGQVEELTFRLRQLEEQLQRVQEDNEFRFRELEGGGPAPVRQSEAPAGGDQIGTMAAEAPAAPAQQANPGLGAPAQPLGTLVLDAPADAGGQPLDLTSLARGDNGQPAAQPGAASGEFAVASTGDPRADYDQAYSFVLAGNFPVAEASFRQFIDSYPTDQLAPDAQYWLGESLFARGMYRDAADEFLAGYKAYPKAGKGADTLLKLGLSLAGLGEREAACSIYTAVLKEYPDAPNALRQRVNNERASASC